MPRLSSRSFIALLLLPVIFLLPGTNAHSIRFVFDDLSVQDDVTLLQKLDADRTIWVSDKRVGLTAQDPAVLSRSVAADPDKADVSRNIQPFNLSTGMHIITEPSAWLLLATGFLCLIAWRRMRSGM